MGKRVLPWCQWNKFIKSCILTRRLNSKKTKVMIFQKRAKKNSNLEFHVGKETIGQYTWIYIFKKTRISSTGNFNISLEHLKEKALHALFGLRKHANLSKAMISPIWGVYVKHDFKAWDNTPTEKTHLKFCKRYLEISNKASNVASRSELGRFLLVINIYKNILHYVL